MVQFGQRMRRKISNEYLHWRGNSFISIVFQLKEESVCSTHKPMPVRAKTSNGYTLHTHIYVYNMPRRNSLVGWDAIVNACAYDSVILCHVCCVCVFSYSVPRYLASTNRLIKLITDWTIRRKMMEWIEHKLSKWLKSDWLNKYKRTWVQTHSHTCTHLTGEFNEEREKNRERSKRNRKKPVHR